MATNKLPLIELKEKKKTNPMFPYTDYGGRYLLYVFFANYFIFSSSVWVFISLSLLVFVFLFRQKINIFQNGTGCQFKHINKHFLFFCDKCATV